MTIPGWTGGFATPPPPPPSRSSHTLRNILIGVGVVAVLCCGAAVTGGIFLFRGIKDATGPVEDTTKQFIDDLRSGDTVAAYGMLCHGAQERFTQQQVTTGMAALPKITEYTIEGVNVTTSGGSTTGVVSAELHTADGFAQQHTFMLVKEDGTWKICGDPF